MDLQTKVSFRLTTNRVMENYTPNGRFIGTHEYDTNVKNLSEFRDFVTNFAKAARFGRLDVDKVTYLINIQRNVMVYDADDRKNFKSSTFTDKSMYVILSTSDKLLYISDIEPLLQKKANDFYMPKGKFDETGPIYIESFDGHAAKYRPLTQNGVTKDVVIDTNLNQIWPIANGESYGTLIELLSKSTEKIR